MVELAHRSTGLRFSMPVESQVVDNHEQSRNLALLHLDRGYRRTPDLPACLPLTYENGIQIWPDDNGRISSWVTAETPPTDIQIGRS